MKRFVLDGEAFDGLGSFYDHAGAVLCPGFGWGRNLDAFNDILRGGFGAFDYGEPIELQWRNAGKAREALGAAETIAWLEERLEVIHPTNRDRWMQRIGDLRRGKGQTLFDELVEILRLHAHIAFTLEGS